MRWLLDLAYLVTAIVTAPIWMFRMMRTGKIRTDWAGRMGRVKPLAARRPSRRRVLVHAVSVGEVNAIRELVTLLTAAGDVEVVVATTTDTGYARAEALWGEAAAGSRAHAGPVIAVIRYPFDFSPAVERFLRAAQPDAVALVELEVWPNFTAACARRGIPVGVVNGRLTDRSFRRYRKVRWLMRRAFGRLSFAAVQNEAYALRFAAMGVAPHRISIAGTMKWDTARIADDVPGADALARELGIDRNRPLIVAGSTAPGEHELLHTATPPGVQLLCAPRKPEWFDAAADALPGCVRRTRPAGPGAMSAGAAAGQNSADRFLLDTIGELRHAYALADLVVVGRSFGELHGSDMTEPIALGKATITGPAVDDFQDTFDALRDGDGIVQASAEQLPQAIAELLSNPHRRRQLAENGRAVIRANQGATRKQAEIVLGFVKPKTNPPPRL